MSSASAGAGADSGASLETDSVLRVFAEHRHDPEATLGSPHLFTGGIETQSLFTTLTTTPELPSLKSPGVMDRVVYAMWAVRQMFEMTKEPLWADLDDLLTNMFAENVKGAQAPDNGKWLLCKRTLPPDNACGVDGPLLPITYLAGACGCLEASEVYVCITHPKLGMLKPKGTPEADP